LQPQTIQTSAPIFQQAFHTHRPQQPKDAHPVYRQNFPKKRQNIPRSERNGKIRTSSEQVDTQHRIFKFEMKTLAPYRSTSDNSRNKPVSFNLFSFYFDQTADMIF